MTRLFYHHIAWIALAALSACGHEEESDDGATEPEATPAERVCEAMRGYLERCGAATPCDDALIADCADVVSIMSDDYLSAVTECIASNQAPLACLQSALGALAPRASHQALASKFCETCALGIPGCEAAFFAPAGAGDDEPRLGALLLPFGDDVVNEVMAECTSGIACASTFLSCAQSVLAKRAIPEQTLACVVDSLANPVAPPPASGSCTSTGTGGASGCDVVGHWQMTETFVTGSCVSAAEYDFTLDIARTDAGHTIVANYVNSFTCQGSIDTTQCTASFSCAFGEGMSGSYTLTFDGDRVTGNEYYVQPGCDGSYSISGQRMP